MTWGSKRRAIVANIFADSGKIVLAAAVVGPIFGPQPAARMMVIAGAMVALACFTAAVLTKKVEE